LKPLVFRFAKVVYFFEIAIFFEKRF
jgi:hypothetical protein